MAPTVFEKQDLKNTETIILPTIKNNARKQIKQDVQPLLLKTLKTNELHAPDSHDIVQTWLLLHSESNKRVQFANETNDGVQEILMPITKITDLNSNQSGDKNDDNSSKLYSSQLASIAEAKLYRTAHNSSLSLSSIASSMSLKTPVNHSLLPSIVHNIPHCAPSIANSSVNLNSSRTNDRIINISLLELNPSLSQQDRTKFDIIRRHVPEEFEQLIPTFLKLGIILWPKNITENEQKLSWRESKYRQYLIKLIDQEQVELYRRQHIHRLYRNVLSYDDISKRNQLLRENLSYQGQLSLLETYHDQIKVELTRKIPNWNEILIKTNQSSRYDDSNLTQRSSIIIHQQKISQKPSSLKQTKTIPTKSQLTYEELYSLTASDKIDQQWQRKSIGKVIERGTKILDEIRNLPDEISSSIDDNSSYLQRLDIIQLYSQWSFLWSTLYT